jgi:hypothetical protein
MFEAGQEIVTVTMSMDKLQGLVKAGLLNSGNHIVSAVRIHGESFDSPEYIDAKKEYAKAKIRLEEITFNLRHNGR